MIRQQRYGWMAVTLCLSLFFIQSVRAFAEDDAMTPEALIENHRASIGGAEVLSKIKSRGISGKASVKFILGATGDISAGDFMLVSEGPKLGLKMTFGDINYPGEYFAFDGDAVTAGYINPRQRSPLAEFIFLYNAVMKEGFLGGVLSTAWPLLDSDEKQPAMKLGVSEVEDQRLYTLEYGLSGKRPGNMKVRLFFDMENFRHVRTEYRVHMADDLTAARKILTADDLNPWDPDNREEGSIFIAGEPGRMAQKPTIMDSLADSKYLLVEKYDNFADVGGLALPMNYSIHYSVEGQGLSFIAEWKIAAEIFTNNGTVDQTFFTAQKD
ncbi:MAG: hypothetical protein JXR49_20285 [Acidobacteria bacterium]|nr:hypothetical protein [Acidobacteriota bacterium]